jgi:hypothetical protein
METLPPFVHCLLAFLSSLGSFHAVTTPREAQHDYFVREANGNLAREEIRISDVLPPDLDFGVSPTNRIPPCIDRNPVLRIEDPTGAVMLVEPRREL